MNIPHSAPDFRFAVALFLCTFGLIATASAQSWTQIYSGSGTLYSEDDGDGGWNYSYDSHSFSYSSGGVIRISYSGTINARIDFGSPGWTYSGSVSGTSMSLTSPTTAGWQSIGVACDGGPGDSGTYTITVEYLPGPTAQIANRSTAKEGEAVTLDGSGSTSPAGIASYAWDIDNNGTTDATGATPSVSFPTPFPSNPVSVVKLTVTDIYGAKGSTTRSVWVFDVNYGAIKVAVQNGVAAWNGYGPESPLWCPGNSQVTLTANAAPGGAPYSAGWKINSGSLTGINPAAFTTTGTLGSSDVSVSATYGPSTPGSVGVSSSAYNVVNLSWTASVDNVAVTNYDIYRQSAASNNPVLLGTVGSSTTTFSDTHVWPSVAYSYTVKARDGDGNSSAPSAAANVTTPAAPDTDGDGVPDVLETTFGIQSNANASSDTNLGLKINRPIP